MEIYRRWWVGRHRSRGPSTKGDCHCIWQCEPKNGSSVSSNITKLGKQLFQWTGLMSRDSWFRVSWVLGLMSRGTNESRTHESGLMSQDLMTLVSTQELMTWDSLVGIHESTLMSWVSRDSWVWSHHSGLMCICREMRGHRVNFMNMSKYYWCVGAANLFCCLNATMPQIYLLYIWLQAPVWTETEPNSQHGASLCGAGKNHQLAPSDRNPKAGIDSCHFRGQISSITWRSGSMAGRFQMRNICHSQEAPGMFQRLCWCYMCRSSIHGRLTKK